jgi:hypothetical protein
MKTSSGGEQARSTGDANGEEDGELAREDAVSTEEKDAPDAVDDEANELALEMDENDAVRE